MAEAYQGLTGKQLIDIPYFSNSSKGDITSTLKKLLKRVEELRVDVEPDNSTIQNVIDEVVATFLSTIYKLTFLK